MVHSRRLARSERFGIGRMKSALAWKRSRRREELDQVGFRLYDRFRPDVPEGTQGWGAKADCRSRKSSGRPSSGRAVGTFPCNVMFFKF